MGTKVVMDSEAAERLMVIATDMDRYETQVIPDLQARLSDLTSALKDLVAAVDEQPRDQDPSLASRVLAAASTRARRLLADQLQLK